MKHIVFTYQSKSYDFTITEHEMWFFCHKHNDVHVIPQGAYSMNKRSEQSEQSNKHAYIDDCIDIDFTHVIPYDTIFVEELLEN